MGRSSTSCILGTTAKSKASSPIVSAGFSPFSHDGGGQGQFCFFSQHYSLKFPAALYLLS